LIETSEHGLFPGTAGPATWRLGSLSALNHKAARSLIRYIAIETSP
jgi:hypothetical protein